MNSWRLVALSAAFATAGWLAADGAPVEAQEARPEAMEGPWRMFGGDVAGTGGGSSALGGSAVRGNTYEYTTQTGKVYRLFDDCGTRGANGCMHALQVASSGRLATDLPNPSARRGSELQDR